MKKSTEFRIIEWGIATKSKIHSFSKKGLNFQIECSFWFQMNSSVLVSGSLNWSISAAEDAAGSTAQHNGCLDWVKKKLIQFNSIYSRGNQFCFFAFHSLFCWHFKCLFVWKKVQDECTCSELTDPCFFFQCKWRNVDFILLCSINFESKVPVASINRALIKILNWKNSLFKLST